MALSCQSKSKPKMKTFHEVFPKAHQIHNRSRYVDIEGTGGYTACLKPYDLLLNDVGNILFPCNLYSHSIKCAVYICLVLCVQNWWLHMSWILTWTAITAILFSYRRILTAALRRNKPWLDSMVTHVSK